MSCPPKPTPPDIMLTINNEVIEEQGEGVYVPEMLPPGSSRMAHPMCRCAWREPPREPLTPLWILLGFMLTATIIGIFLLTR